jgi:Sec7-like guanine-nucleotide exchange factor
MSQTFPEINTIIASKSRKNQATLGATLFNAKPKNGVAFLEENGLIYADLSPEVTKSISLAKFLKSSTRIDKKVLGEYLAKPDNLELLNAFIGLFDFQKVRWFSPYTGTSSLALAETRGRGSPRAARVLPPAGRGSANQPHH